MKALLGMEMQGMHASEAVNCLCSGHEAFKSMISFIYPSEQSYVLNIEDSKFQKTKEDEKHFKTHSDVKNRRRLKTGCLITRDYDLPILLIVRFHGLLILISGRNFIIEIKNNTEDIWIISLPIYTLTKFRGEPERGFAF